MRSQQTRKCALDLLGLNLGILPLDGGDIVRRVHCKRELEVRFAIRKNLHEARQLLRPYRTLKNLDEKLLLQEGIAEVGAFFDLLCSLFGQIFQAVLQLLPVKANMRMIIKILEPAARRVSCIYLFKPDEVSLHHHHHHVLHLDIEGHDAAIILLTRSFEGVYCLER